ncbi:spore germination protein [Fictibacillus macauensis ZFHKF-1]|uniref:Spore germination protein n=1 Tax=Fictibacillus macauensis ZFHKF-1 TaxID=1196324 RepID=I8AKH4_9BACL|nr:GerAB/ArcD/ProY family transporter [Fictibacillus macauensis]EIT86347.1 spore germination protein [Fictibacillus macauensis ZFHKF-1]
MTLIQPHEKSLVSPYFAFYLIVSMQIGVGILGFQRYIAKSSGHDAWMTVMIAGVAIHALVWMCYSLLNNSGGDLVSIHEQLFGKWVGAVFSTLFFLYAVFLALTALRTYIEVIQVWMFPHINAWGIGFLLIFVAYYFVSGGFRIVTALSFFCVLIGTPIIFLKYFALKNSHFYNLLPLFDHSLMDYYAGTKAMTLNFLGFEMLLMYYPFIKNPASSHKWSQWGAFFTLCIYTLTALESFAYYSQGQLKHTIWATVTIWKIVEFPFIERFEYIGISMWLFVILPNIVISIWVATRIFKRVYTIKQKYSIFPIMLLLWIGCFIFKDRQFIDALNTYVSRIGYYLIFFYIPLLFIIQRIVLKVKGTKHAKI